MVARLPKGWAGEEPVRPQASSCRNYHSGRLSLIRGPTEVGYAEACPANFPLLKPAIPLSQFCKSSHRRCYFPCLCFCPCAFSRLICFHRFSKSREGTKEAAFACRYLLKALFICALTHRSPFPARSLLPRAGVQRWAEIFASQSFSFSSRSRCWRRHPSGPKVRSRNLRKPC